VPELQARSPSLQSATAPRRADPINSRRPHGVVVLDISQAASPHPPRAHGPPRRRGGSAAAGVLPRLARRPNGVQELHARRRRHYCVGVVLRGVPGRLRRQPVLPLLRRRRHVRARHGDRRRRQPRAADPRQLRPGRAAHRALQQ
jgi:hypothetical protein